MKKIKSLIMVMLIVLCLVSCKSETKALKILSPEGIPAIALGGVLDSDNEFTFVSGASVLSTELMQDNYDIIVAPIVLGAQIYLKGQLNYQLDYILTTGNSYLVCRENDKITSLKDLEGETIASYGQNTAPDIILKAALEANGVNLEQINFVYENSVADVLTNRFLGNEPVKYILCAEPVISKIETTLKNKVGAISKINLQDELKAEMELIPQAGVFVNKNADEKAVKKFLSETLKDNIDFLSTNTEDYVTELLAYDGEYATIYSNLGKDVLVNAIPNSSIVFKKAKDNKSTMDEYFKMINKYNSKILNGNEINEEFYKD